MRSSSSGSSFSSRARKPRRLCLSRSEFRSDITYRLLARDLSGAIINSQFRGGGHFLGSPRGRRVSLDQQASVTPLLRAAAENLLLGDEPGGVRSMRRFVGVACALAFVLATGNARAQDAWPSRTITFIVPYAAGGYTDLVGRMAARYVEAALGKTVIVDDRAGAGGIVGTQAVANAAPDGYTSCVCSIGAVSIAPLAQKVGYDPIEDLAPIGIVSSIAQAVIVNKDLPVKTMRELVSYGKANPGKLNYGSSGV